MFFFSCCASSDAETKEVCCCSKPRPPLALPSSTEEWTRAPSTVDVLGSRSDPSTRQESGEYEEESVCTDALPETTRLCKLGCGRPVQAGQTRKGNPYDTCCRSCALNKGIGVHCGTCGGRRPSVKARNACRKGSRCRDRSESHLSYLAHPLDDDYVSASFATTDYEPEPLSLKVIFDWSDTDGSGKLSREELEKSLETIKKRCGDLLPSITDAAWEHLDEDGNGVVNFSEFAAWAGPRLGLPLGMQKMVASSASNHRSSPCAVIGCPCECFVGDESQEDSKCKDCKHKYGLHVSHTHTSSAEVPYPDYWDNHDEDFNKMVGCTSAAVQEFQQLLDRTYRTAFTQDRRKHNPTKPHVPKGFKAVKAFRNENSGNWLEYGCRRAEVMHRVSEEGKTIEMITDVKSMVAWREIGGPKADRLAHECNEWYLFHGTNPIAAKAICENDFKVSRAGSSTGTLYGKGLYFAESITKADEYAKPNESGNYAVLLCRVIGGNVRYCDSLTPDQEELLYSCIEGPYDCVLGDREKLRKTYREFVLFDSEDVYPEYVIEYERIY